MSSTLRVSTELFVHGLRDVLYGMFNIWTLNKKQQSKQRALALEAEREAKQAATSILAQRRQARTKQQPVKKDE